MPKHAYRNASDTFLHAFLAFGSIPKHLPCVKSQSLLLNPGPTYVGQLKRAMHLHSL